MHIVVYDDQAIGQKKGLLFRNKSDAIRWAEGCDRLGIARELHQIVARDIASAVPEIYEFGARSQLVIRSNDRRRSDWGAVREIWFD